MLRLFVVSTIRITPYPLNMEGSLAIPIIGLTTSRTRNRSKLPQFCMGESYTSSLVKAGACPVIIPLGLSDEAVEALLSRLDGILFTGGGDVHPQYYNSSLHPLVSEIDTDRDQLEIRLIDRAVQAGLPFLGICRGIQVINISLGGTLYEDLLDQRPNSTEHQFSSGYPRDYLAHPVQVHDNSRLARILGSTKVEVNSLHHQGINRLAPGLQATALAPDGLVEALELPDHPFGLAVQWHPECLQAYPSMQALFHAFVQAAAKAP